MKNVPLILSVLLVTGLLSACGMKGPLYRAPVDQPAAQQNADSSEAANEQSADNNANSSEAANEQSADNNADSSEAADGQSTYNNIENNKAVDGQTAEKTNSSD